MRPVGALPVSESRWLEQLLQQPGSSNVNPLPQHFRRDTTLERDPIRETSESRLAGNPGELGHSMPLPEAHSRRRWLRAPGDPQHLGPRTRRPEPESPPAHPLLAAHDGPDTATSRRTGTDKATDLLS